MRRHAVIGVLAIPTLALALAACGGGSNASGASNAPTTTASSGGTTSSAQGGTTLQLEAASSGALEFDKSSLEAPAGEVTIEMTNPSSVPHDIALEGNGVDVVGKVVTDGGTSTVSANLTPGTYTFFCSVDSHADAGMKGALTVK
jgi:plastocyanin